MVIDIGGGSTELIVGEGLQPLLLNSVELGCVHFSQHFFAHKVINSENFAQAIAAARALAALGGAHAKAGLAARLWHFWHGTRYRASATKQGFASPISAAGLEHLRQELCAIGHMDAIHLAGLKPERRSILWAVWRYCWRSSLRLA